MGKLNPTISLPPDRDNPVIEIFDDNRQLAEVSLEPGQPMVIQFYANVDGEPWSVDFEEFLKMLEFSRAELKSRVSPG